MTRTRPIFLGDQAIEHASYSDTDNKKKLVHNTISTVLTTILHSIDTYKEIQHTRVNCLQLIFLCTNVKMFEQMRAMLSSVI
jgi:hypothetical protein